MEENTSSKVGEFFSSLFGKIVNLLMVLVIVGLVVLAGWFWHRNEMLKGDVENLQEKVDELEEMLDKNNDEKEGFDNVRVIDNDNKISNKNSNEIEIENEL